MRLIKGTIHAFAMTFCFSIHIPDTDAKTMRGIWMAVWAAEEQRREERPELETMDDAWQEYIAKHLVASLATQEEKTVKAISNMRLYVRDAVAALCAPGNLASARAMAECIIGFSRPMIFGEAALQVLEEDGYWLLVYHNLPPEADPSDLRSYGSVEKRRISKRLYDCFIEDLL